MRCWRAGFRQSEKMTVYGGNSFAVMFQKTEQAEPLPENKSQALPAHTPMVAGAMPGGKPTAKGRYPKGMKTLPNPWHQPKRRKKGLGRLMGE
jgi:hypothetical protein